MILIVLLDASLGLLRALQNRNKSDERLNADIFRSGEEWASTHFSELAAMKLKWQPYSYWVGEPATGHTLNIDKSGRRKTWSADQKVHDTPPVRIFVFGGSTVWGTGVRDDSTVPSHLAKAAADEISSRTVSVSNYGQDGYVSTQEVLLLEQALRRGEIPDIVIFYDGVNDVYSAYQHGRAGIPQNEWNREREFNTTSDRGKALYVAGTTIIRQSNFNKFANAVLYRLSPKQPAPAKGRHEPGHYDTLASEVLKHYQANFRRVEDLANEYGFEAFFFWQPVIYTKPNKTPYEELQIGAANGEMYQNVYKRLSKDPFFFGRENFKDISGIFGNDSTPRYMDFCHISESGNAVIGREIFDFIIDRSDVL